MIKIFLEKKIIDNKDGFDFKKEVEQLDNSVKNHIFYKGDRIISLENISKQINGYFR